MPPSDFADVVKSTVGQRVQEVKSARKHHADALKHAVERLNQAPESGVQFNSGFGSVGRGSVGVEEVAAPEDLADEYELYKSTPLINRPLHQFQSDVLEPGYRVTADSSDTEDWFNDEFLPQAGISGGQRHQDFQKILEQNVIQFMASGNILTENVKDNGGETVTGFLSIRPESVKLATEPNKPILVAPDSVGETWFDGKETPRGEAAAYLQYHSGSILGQKGAFQDKDVVPLSQNDVTKISRAVPAGEIWGVPITRTVADRVTALKNKMIANEEAIKSKAWGIWSVAFETEAVEAGDETIVTEWSDEDQDEFMSNLGTMGAGDVIGHDGTIDFQKYEGSVSDDVLDFMEFDIKYIISAMPTPLYAIGWEENINQFVVKEQEVIYDSSVRQMQAILEDGWTPTLRRVAEQHGYDHSGLQLHIQPSEDASPIRTMDVEEVEKFALYADGLKSLLGQNGLRAMKPEYFADLVAQLPEEAFDQTAFLGVPGGKAPEVRELPFLDTLENSADDISVEQIEKIRARMRAARNPDDEASVAFPTAMDEMIRASSETGGGARDSGLNEDRDRDRDEQQRDADGHFT